MAWYAKMEAIKGGEKGSDAVSDTLVFAEAIGSNGDVDGRDFLVWQRGGSPNVTDDGLLLPANDLVLESAEAYGKVQFQDFHFSKRCDSQSESDHGLLLPAVNEVELDGGWFIPLLA